MLKIGTESLSRGCCRTMHVDWQSERETVGLDDECERMLD